MSPTIQQMTIDEFAESRIALGDPVKKFGSAYWVRTRRLFFRPLLSHEACLLSEAHLPVTRLGGFQCVVSLPQDANSVMKFVVLDDVRDYDLERLRHDRRLLIKNAAKRFAVRPVQDIGQLMEEGFEAYGSFYERTGYGYQKERVRRERYDHWVDCVLKCPKTVILGGYDQRERLHALSLSYWVGHTLHYTTFFAETEALRHGVGELMFHAVRELARRTCGIREVLVRRYQGGNGMDNYYLRRGAKLIAKPSKLHLDSASRWILKSFFPVKYAILCE